MSAFAVRRAPTAALATLALCLVLLATLLHAEPAAAHARVERLDVAADADVSVLDGRIALVVSHRDATIEGDPIAVFDPRGRRIDAADPQVDAAGTRISVGITAGDHLPGEYVVVYHVVSSDSHVVHGESTFSLRPVSGAPAVASPPSTATATDGAALHREGGIAWPALLGCAVVAGAGVRRQRRSASAAGAPTAQRPVGLLTASAPATGPAATTTTASVTVAPGGRAMTTMPARADVAWSAMAWSDQGAACGERTVDVRAGEARIETVRTDLAPAARWAIMPAGGPAGPTTRVATAPAGPVRTDLVAAVVGHPAGADRGPVPADGRPPASLWGAS